MTAGFNAVLPVDRRTREATHGFPQVSHVKAAKALSRVS